MKKRNNKKVYAEGGTLNSIVGGIGLVGGLINSIGQTASGYSNYDAAKEGILLTTANRVNTIAGVNSMDDLEGAFSAYRNLDMPTLGSNGSTAGGILGSVGAGASAGSALGPIGGVVGGVLGGIGGAIGSLFGRNKKKKLKRNLLNQVDESNELAISSLLNRADAVDTYNDINIQSGYAALGGLIPSIGSTSQAINYDLTNRRIENQTLNAIASIKNTALPSQATSGIYDLGGYLGDIQPLFKNAEFAEGGLLVDTPWLGSTHGSDFTNGLVLFNEGGTHGLNPYGGIPLGINPETGEPNLVEEGETKFEDYVFSDRLRPTKDLLTAFNLGGEMSTKTFADISKSLGKESEERPNDPISKRGLLTALERLRNILEIVREDLLLNMFAEGGFLSNLEHSLRYAPVVGTALGVLGDITGITNNPNDLLDNMPTNLVQFTPVNSNPIGNYLSYNPLDNNYLVNTLNALSGATRSGLRDASGGNRGNYMAGLLAADNNALNAIGQAYRLAQESNINQRMQVENFNRGTNQFNSQLGLQADLANAEGRISASRSNADIADRRFLVANQIIDRSNAGRAANLTNLFNNLGEVGRERVSRLMIMDDPSKYYTIDRNGRISYKGIDNLTPSELSLIRREAEAAAALGTNTTTNSLSLEQLNLMNFYNNFRNLTRNNNR